MSRLLIVAMRDPGHRIRIVIPIGLGWSYKAYVVQRRADLTYSLTSVRR